METTLWLRVRAQRALCAAAILARAAALIVRRPRLVPVLLNPDSALIAVSRAFTCCAALSRPAFNSAIMSMCSPRARIVANNNRKLRGPLHQLEEHAQCLIKLVVFRCAESVVLPYSVLMNRITRGFYPFRKFTEIEFDDSSVVQLLPCGIGHSGLPAGVTRKRGVPGYCASARITLARSSKLVRFTELAGRIISNETDPKECGLEVCYEIAHLGVGSRPDWMGLLRVRLDVSSSFATQRS